MMMTDDDTMEPRREYVIDTILELLVPRVAEPNFTKSHGELKKSLASDRMLEYFLNDADSRMLVARTQRADNDRYDVVLSTEARSSDTTQEVYFIKQRAGPVPTKNFQQAFAMMSLSGSALHCLQLAINDVYAPKLLSEDDTSSVTRGGVSDKLQTDLLSLKDDLKHAVLLRGTGRKAATDERDTSSITCVDDEYLYWSDVYKIRGKGAKRAGFFVSQLQILCKQFAQKSLQKMNFEMQMALLDECQETLTSLWHGDGSFNRPYPQERMVRLLEVLATAIVGGIKHKILAVKVWASAFVLLNETIVSAIRLLDHWSLVTTLLTTHDWSDRWQGDPYVDTSSQRLKTRLNDIAECRRVHHELEKLLPPEDCEKFRLHRIFTAFESVTPLNSGVYTQTQWQEAMDEFDRLLRPLEAHAATLLGVQLLECAQNPQSLLRLFRAHSSLLSRSALKQSLQSQEETLLTQLCEHLDELRRQFEGHCTPEDVHGDVDESKDGVVVNNMSALIRRVTYAHTLQHKAAEMVEIVMKAIPHVTSIDNFSQSGRGLCARIDQYKNDVVSVWQEQLLDRMSERDNPLVLRTTGRLMQLDVNGSGELHVHYSEELVTLLREARVLSELGFKVHSTIQKAVDTGEKYYMCALKLKQVASFYNTITDQIVPSQMGLLLSEANAFESIIQKHDGATWNSPAAVHTYMKHLMRAAEALTSRNRKLRGIHATLCNDVVDLLNTDFLRQNRQWLEKQQQLRRVFARQAATTTPEAIALWKRHWNDQLYKALELQYRMGLESLSENLDPISVDLVFTRRQLAFRPSVHDLRLVYQRRVRVFIDAPKVFTGVDIECKTSVFSRIPERCASGIFSVHANGEILLRKLQSLKASLRGWVVFGCVDIEQLARDHLHTIDDWHTNFVALKRKRRELDKLDDSQSVGCFRVSMTAFKSVVEDHLNRWSDTLLLSLKTSASDDMVKIMAYLDASMARLHRMPHSVKEMAVAKSEWSQIQQNQDTYYQMIMQVEQKNKLLMQITGVSLDLHALRPQWDAFVVALDAFNDMLGDQKDELMNTIAQRIREIDVDVLKFSERWKALKPNVDEGTVTADVAVRILSDIDKWDEEYDALMAMANETRADAVQFDMDEPEFKVLADVRTEIDTYKQSWALYGEYSKALMEMSLELWVSFRARLEVFDDFLSQWSRRLKEEATAAATGAAAGGGGGRRAKVVESLKSQIKSYRSLWPVLDKCRGDLFEREHWRILFVKLGFPPKFTLDELTLSHFLERQNEMIAKSQEITALALRARGEVTIREAVQELQVWQEETEFALLQYTTSSSAVLPLIKGWKNMFTEIGDQQSLLQSLKDSPYFRPFADICDQFELRLSTLDTILQDLNAIQRKWVYLEPIFGRGALPHEQGRFTSVDREFRVIMESIADEPNVMRLASQADLKDTVRLLLDQLDRCQRALNEFLEEKRSKFPRFYFIGDDDLLEILGQAQKPHVIQSHLKKLFGGIHSVQFSDDCSVIECICSSENEVVRLVQPVCITPEVEVWLQQLANEMVGTMQQLLAKCVNAFDLHAYPSQILCLSEQISYTHSVESALNVGRGDLLVSLKQQLDTRLAELTGFDAGDDKLLRLKVKALVLDLIHNIQVTQELIDSDVCALEHWLWQKQLRFYLNDQQSCFIRMCDAYFDYTYEYQGNAAKLVQTPLNDKCYLVLTQGMHLGYGGNPYGPAGTGKTESVKALGQAMGRQVLVFNCDEGIDFQSMGRIFSGLVKSGAWGCFDEFNRLKEDQLSAVSQQIQVIQAALKERKPTCSLLDHEIDVNANAAIFVTLNPASKEYGGRSKLPHNLKLLFRSVAMSAPDIALIARVILYSEGFQHADIVGPKVVKVYSLAKQLLSPQKHYDWGLRAMKTVLRHGGQLCQSDKRQGKSLDVTSEIQILIGALRVNTLSKLTYADSIKFNALIQDVFPGIHAEAVEYRELELCIRDTLVELELEVIESQIKKVLQLYEALNQRMGVVIVGPSGSGKTSIWRILHKALERMNITVVKHVLNPKALSRVHLLGSMDHDTREWTDGVLTASARAVVKEPADVSSWIVCDGDIDPEWIESLNSVLDDNRLLTLPNGERIQFGGNINFIFESHDLQYASPATISRMGMIFLSENDIDVKSIIRAWLRQQDESMRQKLQSWIDEYFHKSLAWVVKEGSCMVKTTRLGIIQTALSHVTGDRCTVRDQFLLGLIRGIGGNMCVRVRQQYAKALFTWAKQPLPAGVSSPLYCEYNAKLGTLCAYPTDGGSEGVEFKSHSNGDDDGDDAMLSAHNPPMIHTVHMQACRDIVQPWLDRLQPCLLVGPQGCGKSLLMRNCIHRVRGASVITLHCSSQTQATHLIQKLKEGCSVFTTNRGRVLRPREGDRLMVFLKDVNLPKPDQYDTMQLIALLQQLITYGGFYDANLEWLSIERVQFVATMNPSTTVGRHELSTRFAGVVNIAYMEYAANAELQQVYASMLSTVINTSGGLSRQWRDRSQVDALSKTVVLVYEQVKKRFLQDDHRHYSFNPRDITKWVCGLLRYELTDDNLLDVLSYEAFRVFADRLVDRDSKKDFVRMLIKLLKTNWRHELNLAGSYFTSLLSSSSVADDTTVTSGAANAQNGRNLLHISSSDFNDMVRDGVRVYERQERKLNLELFTEALNYIAYVDRILSVPCGSLLLVGSSGVGRRSAVTIVSHMLNMEVVSPNLSLHYGEAEFRVDLKDILKRTGVCDDRIVLLMEDHHFVQESFFEYINSLLSSSEVPGLFAPKELDALLSGLKDSYDLLPMGTYRNINEYFVSRVRANLHIVLSMDPSHPKFALRCEGSPAIYAQCSILWMGEWSNPSMYHVPMIRLQRVITATATAVIHDDNNDDDDDDDSNDVLSSPEYVERAKPIVKMVMSVHESMKPHGIASPRKYIAFIKSYIRIHNTHHTSILTERRHLSVGLDKLSEAAATVDEMSKHAQAFRNRLKAKQDEASQALVQITERMGQAADRKSEVERLQGVLSTEEKQLNVQKAKIEEQLSDVQPLIDAAKSAIKGIKKAALNEIKAFRIPPPAINHVLSGVLLLLHEFDHSWSNMKRFLSPSVINRIITFDARTITPDVRAKVLELIKSNKDSFDQVKIEYVNKAAAPLAGWVKANIKYSAVLQSILPLEEELQSATTQLTEASTRLDVLNDELAALDAEVEQLKDVFATTTGEAEQLKVQLQSTEDKLGRAQSLLEKLGGERDRWAGRLHELSSGVERLPRHALVAAAFVTYLGGYSEDTRSTMLEQWMGICGIDNDDYQFLRFISSESQLLKWRSQGLPSDGLSLENAQVLTTASQCPYVIDPNLQATEWLKTHLQHDGGAQKVECVLQQESRFVNQLELAVRFGKVLIVHEVDEVDPILFPLLKRELYKQGSRYVVRIGAKAVDYNDEFRLFLVTRDPSTTLPAYIQALLCEVNFTITRSGLEDQLLGITLNHERPELEHRKAVLLKEQDALKMALSELEDALLERLAESEGDILENTALLANLNETKSQSMIIAEKLAHSKTIQDDLDTQRDVYRPIATMGSQLHFVIRELVHVNAMYQFSLPSFIDLFTNNLKQPLGKLTKARSLYSLYTSASTHDDHNGGAAGGDDDHKNAELRMSELQNDLKHYAFMFITRSLLKDDQLIFGLHLVHTLYPSSFGHQEWAFFVDELVKPTLGSTESKSSSSSTAAAAAGGCVPEWLPADRRTQYHAFVSTFPQLANKLELSNVHKWSKWMSNPRCECVFPQLSSMITAFQRLMVVKVCRPERLYSAMHQFVCESLGVKSLATQPLQLEKIAAMSKPSEPVLFVATAGADPSHELNVFAERTVGAAMFRQIAMGQGQTQPALDALREAANNGGWVLLKNLHLVISWLPTLEKELTVIAQNANPRFRLWLTTEPHDEFPSMLLQQSLKLTYEAPPGLKQNMLRTYSGWTEQYIAQGTVVRSQMMFVLAWFHAVVQERRIFVPQGWTKPYEFSYADLRSGCDIIDFWCGKCENATDIPWDSIWGLLESAIYGGRISDEPDIRILRAYLHRFFAVDTLTNRRQLDKSLCVPTTSSRDEAMRLIHSLGNEDSPASFALPDNVQGSMQRHQSVRVFDQLRRLRAASHMTNGFCRRTWKMELQPLLTMWSKLFGATAVDRQNSALLSPPMQLSKPETQYTPTDAFIVNEAQFVHGLVMTMDESLQSLHQVLCSSGLLTPDIVADGVALLAGRVPERWSRSWDCVNDPSVWIREVTARKSHIHQWLTRANTGTLVTKDSASVNLSELFHPRVFLNALGQETARALQQPIDSLQLVFSWDTRTVSSVLNVQVSNILLQGAGFTGSTLSSLAQDAPSYCVLPSCTLAYVTREEAQAFDDGGCIQVPLYCSSTRETHVCDVRMPCRPAQYEQWILTGMACMLTDLK